MSRLAFLKDPDSWVGIIFITAMLGVVGFIIFTIVMSVCCWDPPPVTTVADTRVTLVRDGEIIYLFLRNASGRDSIGYSTADYHTIQVDLKGQCYREVVFGKALPIICTEEIR